MPASIANGTRPGENRATRSKNPRPQAVHVLTTAPPAQKCFGYVRGAAAIHLEFQRPETRRRAAARERFLRTQVLALLVISNDAEPELRSPLKMFFLEMAIRTHRPATRLRSSFGFAVQFPMQTRGYTQDSSRAQRVFATLPSLHPALLRFPEHARPIPYRTQSREAHDPASCAAKSRKRKTSSQIDSLAPAGNGNLPGLIIAALGGFAAAKKQIDRHCRPKDFQAGGIVR